MSPACPAPEPLRIESVRLDPDNAGVIIIEDQDLRRWYYLQDAASGNLILGRPYALVNQAYAVKLFVPSLPGLLPYLLEVRPNGSR